MPPVQRAILLSALLALPAALSAQVSGALSGHVRDAATGRGIPNALVTVEGSMSVVGGAWRKR